MEWFFLGAAIVSEVAATLSLRVASAGRTRWYAVVAAGYVAAFLLLSGALEQGIGLGVAYGIWAAAGVALTAVASRVLFAEPLTPLMSAGIALIIGGVLLLELGGAH
jgi:small multidrug resistance pump